MTKAYEVLGVDAGADEATINAAFRKAAKGCHPDLNGGDRRGERRLRRLIAARDHLTSRRRRLSTVRRRDRGTLRLQSPRRSRRFLFAGSLAFAGVFFFFASFGFWKQAGPAAGPFETTTVYFDEDEIPDAGSAEVKAIRDVREMVAFRPSRAEPKVAPPPDVPARHVFDPAPDSFQDAVREAASEFSRTWRKLASRLRGI